MWRDLKVALALVLSDSGLSVICWDILEGVYSDEDRTDVGLECENA